MNRPQHIMQISLSKLVIRKFYHELEGNLSYKLKDIISNDILGNFENQLWTNVYINLDNENQDQLWKI